MVGANRWPPFVESFRYFLELPHPEHSRTLCSAAVSLKLAAGENRTVTHSAGLVWFRRRCWGTFRIPNGITPHRAVAVLQAELPQT
ncbi:hypothetical protein SKAU_G00428560 [Synaphobranchus kaupii]|uniref:Uncharacterized protein n=1 Tax=Synaphobranchus kaupii TaxID=118154 RepID=A0A9Q1IA29_SYNKA|nr:hypothetical protein SKAU_G00428560 [Synaphobranchus kaupii]